MAACKFGHCAAQHIERPQRARYGEKQGASAQHGHHDPAEPRRALQTADQSEVVGLLHAHVEHTDDVARRVPHWFVGGEIRCAQDVGLAPIRPTLLENRVMHRTRRKAGADRARAVRLDDVGADAQVAAEQGRGAAHDRGHRVHHRHVAIDDVTVGSSDTLVVDLQRRAARLAAQQLSFQLEAALEIILRALEHRALDLPQHEPHREDDDGGDDETAGRGKPDRDAPAAWGEETKPDHATPSAATVSHTGCLVNQR